MGPGFEGKLRTMCGLLGSVERRRVVFVGGLVKEWRMMGRAERVVRIVCVCERWKLKVRMI